MNKTDYIHISPVFRDFDGKDLADVAAAFQELSFEKGDRIFAEGDKGDSLYVIMRGVVAISKESKGGADTLLTKLGPNAIFGEMAIIDNSPRSASSTADEATSVIMLTKENFDKMVNTNKRVALTLLLKVSRLLSMKLRKTSAEFSDIVERHSGS